LIGLKRTEVSITRTPGRDNLQPLGEDRGVDLLCTGVFQYFRSGDQTGAGSQYVVYQQDSAVLSAPPIFNSKAFIQLD